jgi:hypothetical protein
MLLDAFRLQEFKAISQKKCSFLNLIYSSLVNRNQARMTLKIREKSFKTWQISNVWRKQQQNRITFTNKLKTGYLR